MTFEPDHPLLRMNPHVGARVADLLEAGYSYQQQEDGWFHIRDTRATPSEMGEAWRLIAHVRDRVPRASASGSLEELRQSVVAIAEASHRALSLIGPVTNQMAGLRGQREQVVSEICAALRAEANSREDFADPFIETYEHAAEFIERRFGRGPEAEPRPAGTTHAADGTDEHGSRDA